MIKKSTKMVKWNVYCENCGTNDIAYVLAGYPYGRLLGRTSQGELAEINTFQNTIFEETAQAIDELVEDKIQNSKCFKSILGLISDKAPSGEQYDFTGKMYCRKCKSDRVKYGPDDPPETMYVELPYVTHKNWNQLSEARRIALLRERLQKEGCI